ncbi:hypothetical protein AWM75_08260 [Aerococcus urinaehominis]|uniref:cysteine desulfurase n=1 Tax=Aerococcus urinaehominis TaxID=128944 RepID=A0A0X8FMD2_9LACT|nr:cysteine desulfurase [Aerococcus urinaehominis]AMB99963.1 hypothetical protein AWM75_08260 [Aerococcus urinaehominis]SDM44759.1 cysteine desulfurase / selenocysteine lyase [Aerococcus urinaehominis]
MTNPYRADFPILDQKVNDEPLIYFDNAATSQTPKLVLDRLYDYYTKDNANIHRGVHSLAERATQAYEAARIKLAGFINAQSPKEVIFTSGTTQGLNWLSRSLADFALAPGDEIVLTQMEHHSNLVPWQEAARRHQAKLVFLPYRPDGSLTADDLAQVMTDRTKIVAVTHVSNVLGSLVPVKDFAQIAHQAGAYLVVDGAQAVPHLPVDVQDLDADFYAFSGHKMYGPTGTGVLYGKADLLKQIDPIQFGGEMISLVEPTRATWADLPYKFEAGTQNIAGQIGLAAAVDYIESVGGMAALAQHEADLVSYAMDQLQKLDFVDIYGSQQASDHHGVIAFNVQGVHPHDLATGLDLEGIAVRAGHHCAQPLMACLQASSTARISFALYNTRAEIDQFIQSLTAVKEFFTNGLI